MNIVYNFFVSLLVIGMKTFSIFNSKAKKGVEGRRQSLEIVRSIFASDDKVLWMHAASLGEYDQGLPVLEKLKQEYSNYKVLITFFSPSGYENVIHKNNLADAICYLPFDRKNEVKEFVSSFNCQIFFTVKYDYWYNLLETIKARGSRVYVVSSLFYERQIFFKFYGKWFVQQLKNNVDWFFHQTDDSCSLALEIGLDKSSVSGDTRYDRVKQFLKRDNFLEFIKEFKGQHKMIVFGSSWKTEESIAQLLAHKLPKVKFAIAPHDLDRIPHLKKIFPSSVLYSSLLKSQSIQASDYQVIIIDSIGKLSRLYSYADVAVVGGGYHSAGLHNILEAAVYSIPVFFGNRYKKNPEADSLKEAKGALSFHDFVRASAFIVELIKNDLCVGEKEVSCLKEMGENAGNYIASRPHSAEVITRKMISIEECKSQYKD